VKHLGAIAGRELRSYFVSPVAYVVLVLFAVLGGFFFVASVLSFDANVSQAQQFQAFDFLNELNLNDHLLMPFYQIMWIVVLFLVPGLTMGLFASEKTNGTQELLMTSPITIWELVLGKYLAAAAMVTLLVVMLGAWTGILFLYGDPEPAKTLSGLLGLWLIGLTYAAVGCFASSLTRNQLIAFFLALVLLLILWLLAVVADLGAAGGAEAAGSGFSDLLRWLSSADHFEDLMKGLVDTRSLAYFGFMIGSFLLLTKAAVESVRWR
jgi:ABC-2 type transport system permease protein